MKSLSRRTVVMALVAASAAPAASATQPLPRIVVTRDPSCGCCGAWVDHLRAAGFAAEIRETHETNRVKARLGVPAALHSCHTAEIDGYVIEGHVPAAAIRRLIAERPPARGLAVPGMPIGSPGMEIEGHPPDTYDVILFGSPGQRVFMRFRGGEAVGS